MFESLKGDLFSGSPCSDPLWGTVITWSHIEACSKVSCETPASLSLQGIRAPSRGLKVTLGVCVCVCVFRIPLFGSPFCGMVRDFRFSIQASTSEQTALLPSPPEQGAYHIFWMRNLCLMQLADCSHCSYTIAAASFQTACEPDVKLAEVH